MKQILKWGSILISFVATILGVNWARRKLEARGEKKQHARQVEAAKLVNVALAEGDKAHDAEAEASKSERADRREAREAEDRERRDRGPTADEVADLERESME